MQFSMCRRPYPGELFYGYMRALCKMNGFDKMKELEHYFLSGGADNVSVNVAISAGLAKICDVVENQTFPSLEEAIAMTPFYRMIEGLLPEQIAKLAETMIYAKSSGVPNIGRGRTRSAVKICPDCWKEDAKQYDESYLHVVHHLENVKVCWKHKTPLISVGVCAKQYKMIPIEPEYGEVLQIDDMEKELAYAIESVENMKHNETLHIFQNLQCHVCGKHYILPKWSVDTGAPCPYCSEHISGKEFIQHRLDYRYPGEYMVIENNMYTNTKVMHLVCESVKENTINKLLYGKPCACAGCIELTPKNLYRKYGSKDWIFYGDAESPQKNKKIHVKHKICGNEFDIYYRRFSLKKRGYCPYCENPNGGIDISDIDAEYEIVGDYKNNQTPTEIKHRRCGCVFKIPKASFRSGTRCPICVPRYLYQDVVDAVEKCTGGVNGSKSPYILKKAKKGYLDVIHGSDVYKHVSYTQVMADLKREVPKIFKDRHTVYRDKRSVRKVVYDNVIYQSLKKGYWTFSDGLDGKEVTTSQRNAVQDLARLGYIHRISKGKYAIAERGETE